MALVLQNGAEWTRSLLPVRFVVSRSRCKPVRLGCFLLQSKGNPYLQALQPSGHYGFQPVLEPLVHGNHGRVLVYMLLAQVMVQISSPYFTPYMLCQLKLSYAGYVALTAAAYVARIAFLPIAGRIAAHSGRCAIAVIGLWQLHRCRFYGCRFSRLRLCS